MPGCLLLFLQPRPEKIAEFKAWRVEDSGLSSVTRRLILNTTNETVDSEQYPYVNLYEVSQITAETDESIEKFLQSGADYILRSSWQSYETLAQIQNSKTQVRSIAPPIIVCVGMTVPESPEAVAELNAWYKEEHIPGMATVPGWRAATRYTLLRSFGARVNFPVAPFLAVHEWEQENGLGGEEWKKSVFTPWTEKITQLQTAPIQRTVWSLSE